LVFSLCFSPDGKTLASGGWFSHDVCLWDAATGKLRKTLRGNLGHVRVVVFSPDGKLLAAGGEDEAVRLWHVASGKLLALLLGHDGDIMTLAFSPAGDLLASGAKDGLVKLWDVAKARKLADWAALDKIDPTSRSSFTEEVVAKLRDVSRVVEITDRGAIGDPKEIISGLSFSPDGKTLAWGGDSSRSDLTLVDVGTGKVKRVFPFKGTRILTFSGDGGALAATDGEQVIVLWDPATGEERTRIPLKDKGFDVRSLVFAEDGRKLIGGCADGFVRWWSLPEENKSEPYWMRVRKLPIGAIAYCPKTGHVAAAPGDENWRGGGIWILDLEKEKELVRIQED
jgi:WD40 repeat protein